MTDQHNRAEYCRGCGKPLAADGGDEPRGEGDAYCPQCVITRAESYIREPAAEKPKLERLREKRVWKIALALVLVLCLGIIVYQMPRLLASLQAPKPIRMGSYVTDEVADKCLKNLWQLAFELQQGKRGAGPALVCPASGKPYVISPKANPEIHCPNPGSHGFRDILVSKRNPVPELKK
jgi:hypothetical protein